jgi:predicted anti-sigma-YlaC factor YlaD
MNCETTRMALSAILDGEAPRVDAVEVERHVVACPACVQWREAAHELKRRAGIAAVTSSVTPSAEVLEHVRLMAARPPRGRRFDGLRLALLAIAAAQLSLTLPLLLFGRHDLTRDMGASDVALAVGFLIAAWRPNRALAISPVVGTAAGLLMLSAVVELARGETHVITEAPHAVAFVGWLLVHRIGQLTPPMLEHPDRSMLRSLRRWATGAVAAVHADFSDQSYPAARVAADEASAPPRADRPHVASEAIERRRGVA